LACQRVALAEVNSWRRDDAWSEPGLKQSIPIKNFPENPGRVRSNTIIKRPEGSAEAAINNKGIKNDQHEYQYGVQHGGV
jgi:hypothetical protein